MANGDRCQIHCFIFKTNKFSREIRSSEESEVKWIKRCELEKQKTTVDFKDMIKVFERDDLSEFYYTGEDDKWKSNLL